MSTALTEPQAGCGFRREPLSDESVRTQVWSLLAGMDPPTHRLERRSGARYPYPYLVRLTPVRSPDEAPGVEPVVVVGRYLSERGFSFFHPKPLPFRRVIVTLETASGTRLGFLLDLSWCRFTRHGWYESGGRFLGVAP
jgi:hypothetical protein